MAVKKQRARAGVEQPSRAGEDKQAKPKNKKALIIAKEIKFARLLACNNKKTRDTVLKNLKKWLTIQSRSSFVFTEEKLMRLWRGLFYCMWLSDKPLIQEEMAESLSKIVHCFDDKNIILLYTKCALNTLGTEWFGIDQYRLDKFAMLVRRIIRQTFQVCKNRTWDVEWMRDLSQLLEEVLLSTKISLGFKMHVTELFWEELAKVSCGDLPEDIITILIKPFIEYLVRMHDKGQMKHTMKHIFRYLIWQSDVGLDYMERFAAWKKAGFPTGHIDAMEKIEIPDDFDETNHEEIEEEEDEAGIGQDDFEEQENGTEPGTGKPLDPRAGRVDVELPQIPFNARDIAELLTQYEFHQLSTTISRRQILHLITEFHELSKGNMPLGLKKVKLPNKRKGFTNVKTAALRLLQFQTELYSDKPKNRQKRKRNSQIVTEENNENNLASKRQAEDNISDSEIDDEHTEENIPKKKRQKTADNAFLTKLNDEERESIISSSKKKKKAEKKTQNMVTTETETNSNAIKKLKPTVISSNAKIKKTKVKQNGTASTVKPGGMMKKKKLVKAKVYGSWDISDNKEMSTQSPLAGDAEGQAKVDSPSLQCTQINTNNATAEKSTMWLVPVLKKLKHEKLKVSNSTARQAVKLSKDPNAKKRVKIVLQRNTAQHTSEYIKKIRQSPAIPFDANKKPPAGVLKASPLPSPINPFYKIFK